MLIAAMVGIDTRTTMDMDATIKGQTLSEIEVTTIIKDILHITIDDGVVFTFRGVTNTRMRDFYDIYILTTTQTFDTYTFKAALNKTVNKRGTTEQMADILEIIQIIEMNSIMIDLWQKYRKRYTYASDITWDMVIQATKFLAIK